MVKFLTQQKVFSWVSKECSYDLSFSHLKLLSISVALWARTEDNPFLLWVNKNIKQRNEVDDDGGDKFFWQY